MLKFPPDERCPNCGGLYALIGHRHLCRGAPATEPVVHHSAGVLQDEIARLDSEVKQLKRLLADANLKLVDVVSTNIASTECPTCKARRAVKAKAQRKWRRGSAATATGRPAGP
jgi:hypothetical protein